MKEQKSSKVKTTQKWDRETIDTAWFIYFSIRALFDHFGVSFKDTYDGVAEAIKTAAFAEYHKSSYDKVIADQLVKKWEKKTKILPDLKAGMVAKGGSVNKPIQLDEKELAAYKVGYAVVEIINNTPPPSEKRCKEWADRFFSYQKNYKMGKGLHARKSKPS